MPSSSGTRQPNRLAGEKSPYLLQHALNPVDWYPWGDEAFEKARREDKPIFLSIGYSTCHWCHVMERESFENESVAALLNRDFVPIKVDREERPDVDRVYMTAMQAMGMGGGWPLNAFLTPDLDPFFGGTYFPPDAVGGRAGMIQLLPRVHQAWRENRDAIRDTGARVIAALDALSVPGESQARGREAAFERGYSWFERSHDPVAGGFGTAPKFPSVVNLEYLLAYWARDPEERRAALLMVTRQLDAMQVGGIHDHLGGGFHRYATDQAWLVPHFEKMLYDQAQLASIYLDAFRITWNKRYGDAARGILDYVARDLTAQGGAFDSAEDADSEGEEGRFYVWTLEDLERELGEDEARLFAHRYGVTPQGNFEHATSILSEYRTIEEVAVEFDLEPGQVERRLNASRARLLEARGRRPRPHRDDKIITAWNGLMISAFARGGRVLGDAALTARAERAATFVWENLWDQGGRKLARTWREGRRGGAGQLDDHAHLAYGLLDLYQATFDPGWLERAVTLTEVQLERFWDEQAGAFYESPAGDASIRVRMKDGFDGAEIAGNSIAVWNLVRLGALQGREDWRSRAERTLDYYAGRLGEFPAAMPRMLAAFDLAQSPPRHVVVAGDPAEPRTRALITEFDRRYLPHDLMLLAGSGSARPLDSLVPWTASLAPPGGEAAAFVCVDYACRLPIHDPAAFGAILDERPTSREASRPR